MQAFAAVLCEVLRLATIMFLPERRPSVFFHDAYKTGSLENNCGILGASIHAPLCNRCSRSLFCHASTSLTNKSEETKV